MEDNGRDISMKHWIEISRETPKVNKTMKIGILQIFRECFTVRISWKSRSVGYYTRILEIEGVFWKKSCMIALESSK